MTRESQPRIGIFETEQPVKNEEERCRRDDDEFYQLLKNKLKYDYMCAKACTYFILFSRHLHGGEMNA